MLTHIPPEQAIDLILAQPAAPKTERISLSDALDRILAEDITARITLPPFDKSPFDGYACRASDLPGTLRVVGTLFAGVKTLPVLEPGEAVRIFTGAPVPPSADVVIKQEDAAASDGCFVVSASPTPGTNVIFAGEDCIAGELLIPAGTRLLPAHLGELAGQGISVLTVFCLPKAVLIPTGSELAEPGEPCSPFGIYNSSSYVLGAYLRRMGFSVSRSANIPDEPEAVRKAVDQAMASDADVVFTTGGASVGDYDFAARTAHAIGAEPLFWKVRMKPGGALLVSRLGSKLLVSLSGNPAAALMSLLVVLRPWLMALTGSEDRASFVSLPLKEDMPKTASSLRLLRGHLDFTGGGVSFAEHEGRGNGNIASFARCEVIGLIPGGSGPLKKGDVIRALRLPPELC